MKQLIKLINEGYAFAISETGIELNDYIKKVLPCQSLRKRADKLAVFTVLLYENHPFEITISDSYSISDHMFAGAKNDNLCKTIFIHTSYNDFDKNMNNFVEKIKQL